jgi:hypothetical protein
VLKLILIYLFYLGLTAQLGLALFYSWIFIISFAVSFISKILLEINILAEGRKKILPKISLKYFFLSEFFQIPYITIAGLAGSFGNYLWKERKIRR